jgi:hypothetical protein
MKTSSAIIAGSSQHVNKVLTTMSASTQYASHIHHESQEKPKGFGSRDQSRDRRRNATR